jgi:hypothetical protein
MLPKRVKGSETLCKVPGVVGTNNMPLIDTGPSPNIMNTIHRQKLYYMQTSVNDPIIIEILNIPPALESRIYLDKSRCIRM